MQTSSSNFEELLATEYSLSTEQVSLFQENGFIKLKNVFTKEVLDYYGELISKMVDKLNQNKGAMDKRTTYDKAFLQIFNLWYKDDEIKKLVFSKRLAKIATQLLRVSGVRLYHDQALFKESGGGITPWHTDQYYWPLSNDKTVTVWIPMQQTPMEMGPLAFANKSHVIDLGRTLDISDESEAQLAQAIKDNNFSYTNAPFDLGEVSFHAGWTLHNAGPNTSGSMRKVMTMIYMDKDMKLTLPSNRHQSDDWEKWCSLVKINETISGPLNPILNEDN